MKWNAQQLWRTDTADVIGRSCVRDSVIVDRTIAKKV
jgi:hypothetical protein